MVVAKIFVVVMKGKKRKRVEHLSYMQIVRLFLSPSPFPFIFPVPFFANSELSHTIIPLVSNSKRHLQSAWKTRFFKTNIKMISCFNWTLLDNVYANLHWHKKKLVFPSIFISWFWIKRSSFFFFSEFRPWKE